MSQNPALRAAWGNLLRVIVAGLVGVALVSCAAAPPVAPGSPVPAKMSLMLRVASVDLRLMQFELGPDGLLSYVAGRDAVNGRPVPVCTLTPQQRQAVWDIITRNHILEAKGAGVFTRGKRVTYDLTVDAGRVQKSLRAVDDQVPGLKELGELLFQDQAAVRYKTIPGM